MRHTTNNFGKVSIETLEGRRLLSGVVASVVNHHLVIIGNDQGNSISVESFLTSTGTKVRVRDGGNTVATVRRSAIVGVEIYGNGGDDIIKASVGNLGIFMDGGAGFDTITGGAGDDTIIGGLNDDLIYGNGGNDTLVGDEGKDTIFGGCGNDLLAPGLGDDYANGGSGNDTVVSDQSAGEEVYIGGCGNDTMQYTVLPLYAQIFSVENFVYIGGGVG